MQFSVHLTVLPEPEGAGPNASSSRNTAGRRGRRRGTHSHAAFRDLRSTFNESPACLTWWTAFSRGVCEHAKGADWAWANSSWEVPLCGTRTFSISRGDYSLNARAARPEQIGTSHFAAKELLQPPWHHVCTKWAFTGVRTRTWGGVSVLSRASFFGV